MVLRAPIIIDGIKCFVSDVDEHHKDYPSVGLDNLYRSEKEHFWFVSRREYIIKIFKKYVNTNERIIEIGAGTGSVSRGLMSAGYRPSVGELHLSGLRYAKSYGIQECYQFDLYDPPFKDHFDVIGLFDVLEHLSEQKSALTKINAMLSVNGRLIITVPAHMWLWSREDKIAEHKLRYTKAGILKALSESGFHVVETRYFFVFIVPLLWFRKMLKHDHGADVHDTERQTEITINPLFNRVLLALCRFENKIRFALPNVFGGSIMVVAKKS